VGATALRVAAVRARENLREGRLFADPYAAAFAEPAPPFEGRPGLGAALALHVVLRTRFYDEYLLAAGCRQVVLLAAGLDARAYRLPWPPGTALFEVDLPEVLAVKDRVLAEARPTCDRTAVAADLRGDWAGALLAAGFAPGEPTAWLAEGLLVYLDAEAADRLFTGIDALSAPGGAVACEGGRAPDPSGAGPTLQDVTTLWRGGLAGSPEEWLAGHGWRAGTRSLGAVAAAYGRPTDALTTAEFVTATR
jgi:methyltransferase (TIGR00027 family)